MFVRACYSVWIHLLRLSTLANALLTQGQLFSARFRRLCQCTMRDADFLLCIRLGSRCGFWPITNWTVPMRALFHVGLFAMRAWRHGTNLTNNKKTLNLNFKP